MSPVMATVCCWHSEKERASIPLWYSCPCLCQCHDLCHEHFDCDFAAVADSGWIDCSVEFCLFVDQRSIPNPPNLHLEYIFLGSLADSHVPVLLTNAVCSRDSERVFSHRDVHIDSPMHRTLPSWLLSAFQETLSPWSGGHVKPDESCEDDVQEVV